MDYKEKLNKIKAFLTGLDEKEPEVKEEEVKLEEKVEEPKPEVKEEPKVEYVSLSAFNEFKNEMIGLITQVTEMMAQNEKASVPAELKAEEVKVEEPKKEEVDVTELETIEEVVRHTDEVDKDIPGVKYVNKKPGTVEDRVFEALWG